MSEQHISGKNWHWQEKYLEALANGLRNAAACAHVGVSNGIVRDYKERHPEFLEKCVEAERLATEYTVSMVEEILLDKIVNEKHWQAIVFYLVNMSNGKWKDIRQISVTNKADIQETDALAKDILKRLKDRKIELKSQHEITEIIDE